MTDEDRQQRIDERTTELLKYFAKQAQTCAAVTQTLATWIERERELQEGFVAQRFAWLAQGLSAQIDQAEHIRDAFGTVRDTAGLAEQDLTQLLALMGVELGSTHARR